ncbi:DcaP family trimeric outer membrane transporter [Pedobacter gandavensis]|uniref:DcaP family trimeric outer membrane transporter n=1 Tax=Pedobacter gandavensis TaxID=2679963 RepID=UPI002478EB7F|nr:DcaP family trimeric outer membrane transporter [Pedobacter gandavensis]WGQ11953.1 DcaP family trimeric outer membrane transporter [Pedobacter gandavensis]
MIFKQTLAFLLLQMVVMTTFAQKDSLTRKRLDSLEARLNYLDIRLKKNASPPRTQTRSAVESGRYTGVVMADDESIALQIGGFIQTDAIHDFHNNNSPLGFLSSGIDIPNAKKSNTSYSVAASRFNLSGQIPIEGKGLKTVLEFDLFNSSFSPNLRMAYAEYGKVLVGMYWSNFMDVDAYPNTLDYNGPNSMTYGRQVQFRVTLPVSKTTDVVLALEDPESFLTLPDESGFKALKQVPDLTASIQYSKNGSHLRFASVLHPIVYQNTLQERESKVGYGLTASGVLQQPGNKDNFVFQASYGQGISKYINDIGPDNYDGVYNPATSSLEILGVWGLSASYDHWWSDKFSSTAGWGYLNLNNKGVVANQSFKSSNYGILNLIYYPNSFIKGGMEYLYGTRKNVNGDSANNSRIQLTLQFRF